MLCKNWVRMRWKPEIRDTFVTLISDEYASNIIDSFKTIVNSNVNNAVCLLEKLMHYAGSTMLGKCAYSNQRRQPPWWDAECERLQYISTNV